MTHLTKIGRRQLLSKIGTGMGTLGLAGLLHDERLLAGNASSATNGSPEGSALALKPPHFVPKAKRIIHLFMNGG
ncbi:hypothetical protein N9018_04435, partial [Rhodopirellula sp.]|nr:hypothetical protein [Rhodopirellula sp.]